MSGDKVENDLPKTAALASGGLDSAVLLAELRETSSSVIPIYVRCGLRWEDAEIAALRRLLAASPWFDHCDALVLLDLPVRDVYGGHWSLASVEEQVPSRDASMDSNYLPGRNLLLLSKAAVYCARNGIERVALAPLADNPFADGTPEFFRAFAELATRGLGVPLRIEIPFRGLRKERLIRRAAHLPLGLTLSCLQPRALQHCGRCTKCGERQEGFRRAGLRDPTVYAAS